jgi:tRNA-binding protein
MGQATMGRLFNTKAQRARRPRRRTNEGLWVNPGEAFEVLDLRVGRVVRAEVNERARKPSLRLWIDFGPLGEKTSSAQLRPLYRPEELVGRLVIAAVNLGTRNIAGFSSEVLVLGVPSEAGEVVLLGTEREVPLGGRVY